MYLSCLLHQREKLEENYGKEEEEGETAWLIHENREALAARGDEGTARG